MAHFVTRDIPQNTEKGDSYNYNLYKYADVTVSSYDRA